MEWYDQLVRLELDDYLYFMLSWSCQRQSVRLRCAILSTLIYKLDMEEVLMFGLYYTL